MFFSADELLRAYAPYPKTDSSRWIFERHPELQWPILERHVADALDHLYSVSGILGPQREMVAVSASRKIFQWPPDLGVGIVFEPISDPALIERGLRVARPLVGVGIFEIEFIYDAESGDYLTTDLNPRAHGHIRLDMARGHDLPWLWYQLSRGQPVPDMPVPHASTRWVHSIPNHTRHWLRVLRGLERRVALHDYLRDHRIPSVDVIHDRADPWPSVAFTASMLRHPGGLVRPLWRGSQIDAGRPAMKSNRLG